MASETEKAANKKYWEEVHALEDEAGGIFVGDPKKIDQAKTSKKKGR